MENKDWSEEFQSLFNSALGKELIRSLKEDRYEDLMRSAAKAETADRAYGLIKEASGVMLAIEHIMFLAAVLNRGGGNGNK